MNQKPARKKSEDITEIPLEKRKQLAEKYISETKGHFPFVIQRDTNSSISLYEKPKIILITGTLKIMNLFEVLRKKHKLEERKALFLFVNGNTLLRGDSLIADSYYKYKSEDGFVYVILSDIATWG